MRLEESVAAERLRHKNARHKTMAKRVAAHPNAPKGFVPIPGFEGKYAVSRTGQVFSHYWGKLLRACMSGPTGYLIVSLGAGNNRHIHSLVAWTFLGPQPLGSVVDHKNRIRTDNRVDNLRYVTPSENMHNRTKGGRNGRAPTSQFKGVAKVKHSRPWISMIRKHGRQFILGRFSDEKTAAICYDAAAIKHFGERALTNKAMGLL